MRLVRGLGKPTEGPNAASAGRVWGRLLRGGETRRHQSCVLKGEGALLCTEQEEGSQRVSS